MKGPADGVDNGRMTVHIEWSSPDTDWDIYVIGPNGQIVTQSAPFGDTTEDATLFDPPPGQYRLHVVNYDQVMHTPDDWFGAGTSPSARRPPASRPARRRAGRSPARTRAAASRRPARWSWTAAPAPTWATPARAREVAPRTAVVRLHAAGASANMCSYDDRVRPLPPVRAAGGLSATAACCSRSRPRSRRRPGASRWWGRCRRRPRPTASCAGCGSGRRCRAVPGCGWWRLIPRGCARCGTRCSTGSRGSAPRWSPITRARRSSPPPGSTGSTAATSPAFSAPRAGRSGRAPASGRRRAASRRTRRRCRFVPGRGGAPMS